MVTTINATNGFTPSQYQLDVFQWVQNGKGHAVIKAVPGSGKSTTLIKASKLLATSNAVFLAFNKAIEVELNEKLQAEGSLMKAQTINSFGFSALRSTGKKYKVDGNKYHGICRQYLESQYIEGYSAYEYKRLGKLKKLVSLARMMLVDVNNEEAIWGIVEHQAIEFDRTFEKEEWSVIWHGIKHILEAGNEQAKQLGIIDFDDQVYLPIIWGLTPEKKGWIFVDEAQDLNEARLELIIRSVNGTGRLLFVGDECQAIYGFSGAGTDSMNVIIQRTKATVLPLSICYRCPASHIELCASIFPGLEARPNAPKGTIETIDEQKLYEIVRPGDLVLCRLNAPLVSTCLELIRNGVRAKVRGSDLGANFVATIKKLQKQYPRLNIHTFVEIMNGYRDQQAILIGTGDDADMKVASLDDKVDTMKALREAYCTENTDAAYWTLDGFYSYIENFFSDERGPLVILSTVHKAKGLEENRVFILKPEKMPHPKAKPGWQYEQELNIKYVAFSRSKDALYFVSDKPVSLFNDEDEGDDFDAMVPAQVVVGQVIESTPTIVSESCETVLVAETVNDTPTQEKPSKRPYGGRKALADEDKRVFFQQTWDVSVRAGFKEFTEQWNTHHPDNKYSEAEMLEAVLLGKVNFANFFYGSEHERSYNERQDRAMQKRIDYKNRRSTKKVIKDEEDNNPDPNDNGPNGSGLPTASNDKPEEAVVEQVQEIAVQHPSKIERIAYTCLRPSCKHSWLTDYYNQEGLLYRLDDNGQMILALNDFPECPYCKNKRQYIKVNHPKMTHSSKRKCDSRCWNAKPGSDCACQCMGVHHATGNGGTANMIGQPLLQTSFPNS